MAKRKRGVGSGKPLVETKVEVRGANELAVVMKRLQDGMGDLGKYSSVEMTETPREEGNATNGEILDEMAIDGRDFVSLTNDEFDAIINPIFEMIDDAAKRAGTSQAKTTKMRAVKILQAMMRMFADTIIKHIETGTTASGELRDLSPNYREQKQRKFGSAYPIGIATRQLLNALNNGKIHPRR